MYHKWNDDENSLVAALMKGHYAATFRQNISSAVLLSAYAGSGDYFKAVAAALCSLGGTHAPIVQAYEYLSDNSSYVPDDLYEGRKIPGWGNSFIKSKPDPTWNDVGQIIYNKWYAWSEKIENITELLHDHGKEVYPNAACYTAVTAIILDIPKDLAPMLVLRGRLEAWTELLHDPTRLASQENLRTN